jgi:putative membrane protein
VTATSGPPTSGPPTSGPPTSGPPPSGPAAGSPLPAGPPPGPVPGPGPGRVPPYGAEAVRPDQWLRLSPRSLVSRAVSLRALQQQWGLVVGVLAAFGLRGGFRVAGALGAVVVVGIVWFGGTVVEWIRFSYAVTGTLLVVRRGLLRREVTAVPLDRIRGVDVHASAVQRLLGIAEVRVDAAATGGRHDEARLDAVAADEATRLRHLLLREAAPPPSTVDEWVPGTWPGVAPAPPPVEPLARLRPVWLLYAPLVGGYLIAPLVAVAAVQQYLDDLHVRWFGRLVHQVGDEQFGPGAVLLLAAVVLAVCALGAVATAAIGNWGFTLTRRGGSLISERGLVSRRQVSLERARIRGYSLAQPASLRLVGAARLVALVTGLGGENTRRGQLLPLGPARDARAVAAAILPYGGGLRRHPRAALRRRLVRAVLPGVLVVIAGVVSGLGWLAVLGAVLAGLGVPLGIDRYRGLGHGLDARALAVRSGSLRRREAVLERAGIVGWQVRQTWFQRRAGLATVVAGTGAGGFSIIDAAAADAAAVLAEVDPAGVTPLLIHLAADAGVTPADTLGR